MRTGTRNRSQARDTPPCGVSLDICTERLKTVNTKLVQMRFRPETVERVERLKDAWETGNRTHVVAKAIALAERLVAAEEQGATVYIQTKDGTPTRVKVVGP